MNYRVEITPSAVRQLTGLPRPAQVRLDRKILRLEKHPRPRGAVKLAGAEDLYRIRVGDYRFIYRIDDRRRVVTIARIGHRRDVYR